MKTCSACQIPKAETEFHISRKSKDGLYCYCKPCGREQVLRSYHKTKSYAKSRTKNLKHLYGITIEQFDGLLRAQNHKCAICKNDEVDLKPFNGGQKFAVDHDHKTQKVRGLLCINCNRLLGHAYDDPAVLQSAIQYLASH